MNIQKEQLTTLEDLDEIDKNSEFNAAVANFESNVLAWVYDGTYTMTLIFINTWQKKEVITLNFQNYLLFINFKHTKRKREWMPNFVYNSAITFCKS